MVADHLPLDPAILNFCLLRDRDERVDATSLLFGEEDTAALLEACDKFDERKYQPFSF